MVPSTFQSSLALNEIKHTVLFCRVVQFISLPILNILMSSHELIMSMAKTAFQQSVISIAHMENPYPLKEHC